MRGEVMREQIVVSFPPPGKPWSTNADRNLHWRKRYELISAWKGAATWAFRAAKVRDLEGRWDVHVQIPFATNARRDASNYVGTIVKATVDAGAPHKDDGGPRLWPDDTAEYVRVSEPTLVVDRKGDVIVTLTPIGPNGGPLPDLADNR